MDYDEWMIAYHKNPIINFKNDLSSKELDIFEKLGIKIEDKDYTEYEFDDIDEKLLEYYTDENMDKEELAEAKTLEGTGVSREEYNYILEKFDKIREKYSDKFNKISFSKK
ncbi:MAG: hypothetical protein HFJ42_06260 [Clostridia bacterium]|nr:hypothetical protein [Clostridia bacterium]